MGGEKQKLSDRGGSLAATKMEAGSRPTGQNLCTIKRLAGMEVMGIRFQCAKSG